ncbi:MAG: hypothetical protein ABFD50_08045 [Smithella sp.]
MIDTIFIIAGGPSVKGLPLEKLKGKGFILAVNDSFLHAPFDAIVSMDGRWMFNRYEQLRSIQAKFYARDKQFKKWCAAGWLWTGVELLDVDHTRSGMGETWEKLKAKHSGAMALNIAYLMRPKRIYLFGFDHTGVPNGGNESEHWYGKYPWRPHRKSFNHQYEWIVDHRVCAEQFHDKGIEVFNVSQLSMINVYKRIQFKEIEELR